jgi:hypothetical protein
MLAWSFPARTVDEVARLLRAAGKHRYVRETDHRLHWLVDAALADLHEFAPQAAAFAERRRREPDLDVASRDPSLWRPATVDEIVLALVTFWTPGAQSLAARERLAALATEHGLATADHEPWQCPPDDPPHPELVLLDWELLPVEELDAERHSGALSAMEIAGEEVSPSDPVYQEGPILGLPEVVDGAPIGILPDDFVLWSDGPYAYSDYVFRGVAKAAKLEGPPVGYNDL